jgi:hypothetical protein
MLLDRLREGVANQDADKHHDCESYDDAEALHAFRHAERCEAVGLGPGTWLEGFLQHGIEHSDGVCSLQDKVEQLVFIEVLRKQYSRRCGCSGFAFGPGKKTEGQLLRAALQGIQEQLDLGDVGRLGALLALSAVKADALTFVEGLETGALDRGVVDEKVRATCIGGDESETLFGVEPLDGAF